MNIGAAPADCPPELVPWLGHYADAVGEVLLFEREAGLHAWLQGAAHELAPTVGAQLPTGSVGGTPLQLVTDAAGSPAGIRFGPRWLRRRGDLGSETSGGFRVQPQRPVAELLRECAASAPPAELVQARRPSDLVELGAIDPTLRCELRYATADNFLGTAVYPASARALLQRDVALALARVQRTLRRQGFGLLVFDAYRPWSITAVFWHAVPPELRGFVADPALGSRHNRGGAVDLTLCDAATGEALAMPSEFDEFTARAFPDYPGGTSRQRWHRDLLRAAMAAEQFTVNDAEWWHFDHATWSDYAVADVPLATPPHGAARLV